MKKSRLRKRSILKKARDFAVSSAMYLSAGLTPLLAQQGYIRGLFEGEPIPDATVELNGSTATTNEEGYFQFETSVGETPVITIPKPGNLRYKAFNTLGQEINGDFYQRDNQVYFTPENNIANGMLLIQILGDNFYSSAKALKMGSGDIAFNADRLENKVRHNGKNGRSMQSLDEFSEFRVNANGYYPRVTFVNPGFGDLINETMVDSGFNMESFNLVGRRTSAHAYMTHQPTDLIPYGETVRFIHSPSFYIITEEGAFHPNYDGQGTLTPTQAQIDRVVSIIRNDLPVFTDRLINENTIIEQGNNPPFHYDNLGYPEVDSGYVLVEWRNSIPGIGQNSKFVKLDNPYVVICGVATLNGGNIVGRGIYLQELSQVLGPDKDTELDSTSVMYGDFTTPGPHPQPGIGLTQGIYSESDLRNGKLFFTRGPRNSHPDTDNRYFVELMSRR